MIRWISLHTISSCPLVSLPANLFHRNRQWPCLVRFSCLLAVLVAGSIASEAAARTSWRFHGPVAAGGQLDAQAGPDGRIHLVATRYSQFDIRGTKLADEANGDDRQGSMDFSPALAVDASGTVHLLSRHSGSWSEGFDIRYRRRNRDGTWDKDMQVGGREQRNYVVGIAAAGPSDIFLQISRLEENVWGNLSLWQTTGNPPIKQGELTGIWRADTDARMRATNNAILLVSGRCDNDGTVYFTHCSGGDTCLAEMRNNLHAHQAGTGRRGMPDIAVDRLGQAHMTYGAYQEVYYNRYDRQQRPAFNTDKKIFSGLGTWHLSIGLSAVAASDDGSTIVAVALRSDGSAQASDSDLLWTWSGDGGRTWSVPRDMGVNTDGGEGRLRPRLVAVNKKFFLFYVDRKAPGISMASIDLEHGVTTPSLSGPMLLLLDG